MAVNQFNPVEAFARGTRQGQDFTLGQQSIQAGQANLDANTQAQLQGQQKAQELAALRSRILGQQQGVQPPAMQPQASQLAGQPPVQGQVLGAQPQAPESAPALPANPQERVRALAEAAVKFPEEFEKINTNLGLIDQQKKDEAADFAFKMQAVPFEQRGALIDERVAKLTAEGRSPRETALLKTLTPEQQDNALSVLQVAALSPEARQKLAVEPTAGEREFSSLTEGLTPEQQEEARRIKLGLSPRAGISAQERIAETPGAAEQIGESQAIIEQRKEFGKKTGASRAKAIDSGFERIGKIETNINNLDRAIQAVEAGAGTGAIERRFPSIKAASVELDQIQGELALDVIGAVTFGALSEGELDLAKQIALPAGLEGPQLIKHLQDRKAAQQKLKTYFQEQVDFLDQGGTVAGFLRKKQREAQSPQAATAAPAAGATQIGRFTVEAE